MLRNTLLAAVAVALMPAFAMAAPATAPATASKTAAPAAMTTTVKADKAVVVKHHVKVKKTAITLKHKAKVTAIKS